NSFHITALGQLDFRAVQGNGGVGFQFGLGGTGGQTQLTQQAFVGIHISQVNGSAISRSQGQATVIKFCGNCTTCLVLEVVSNVFKFVSVLDSNSEAINGDLAIQTGNITTLSGCQ